jgi:uncharacterized protein (TIGR04255 family)
MLAEIFWLTKVSVEENMPLDVELVRVRYQKDTLVQVSAEIRFETPFSLDRERSRGLHECLNDILPSMMEGVVSEVKVMQGGEVPGGTKTEVKNTPTVKFYSVDTSLEIQETRLVFSTENYGQWEVFWKKASAAIEAFFEKYGRLNITRCGLRYINVIVREELDLASNPWSDLLQGFALGPYGAPFIRESQVTGVSNIIVIDIDENTSARLNYALVEHKDLGTKGFKIDADLYNESFSSVGDLDEQFSLLNVESRKLFRASITNRLHDAMVPSGMSL